MVELENNIVVVLQVGERRKKFVLLHNIKMNSCLIERDSDEASLPLLYQGMVTFSFLSVSTNISIPGFHVGEEMH